MTEQKPVGVPSDGVMGYMYPAICWRWTRGKDKYTCIFIRAGLGNKYNRYTFSKNGHLHREDGPAVIEGPIREHFLNDVYYPVIEYNRMLALKAFW